MFNLSAKYNWATVKIIQKISNECRLILNLLNELNKSILCEFKKIKNEPARI